MFLRVNSGFASVCGVNFILDVIGIMANRNNTRRKASGRKRAMFFKALINVKNLYVLSVAK